MTQVDSIADVRQVFDSTAATLRKSLAEVYSGSAMRTCWDCTMKDIQKVIAGAGWSHNRVELLRSALSDLVTKWVNDSGIRFPASTIMLLEREAMQVIDSIYSPDAEATIRDNIKLFLTQHALTEYKLAKALGGDFEAMKKSVSRYLKGGTTRPAPPADLATALSTLAKRNVTVDELLA